MSREHQPGVRRRWIAFSARTLAGGAVAVAAVLAVGAGVAAPWPVVEREPLSVSAVPAPEASVTACDGPVLAAGRDVQQAGRITTVADPRAVVGSTSQVPERLQLTTPDVDDSPGAPAYVTQPEGGDAAEVAAAASARLASEDFSGFTVDACRPPLFESWLVGGAATTGWTGLVLIANPGDVTATVDLTVYGADGEGSPPGGSGVAVPPRTQLVIPLAGLALGEESPVVRVTATGAPVRASLQTSLVRTLVPGGIDQETAIAAPAASQVIPGVTVTAPPGADGESDAATIVRVLSPSHDGSAQVAVTAVGGVTPVRLPSTVPLRAGFPAELELGGLAPGAYVVTVTAAAPIVAAVWQATGFGAGSDFAWLTSAPEVSAPTVFAVPSGPAPLLQLANGGDADTTVRLSPLLGGAGERALVVPAHGSAAIGVDPGAVWSLDPGGVAVHAELVFASPTGIGGYAVWPAGVATGAVRVYP